MWTPTLEDKVAFLRDPRSYGASVQQVDVRETHMSFWIENFEATVDGDKITRYRINAKISFTLE